MKGNRGGTPTNKLPRRRFLYLVAGAVALPALPDIATAQAYPTRRQVERLDQLQGRRLT
jgi:hypothetical protein